MITFDPAPRDFYAPAKGLNNNVPALAGTVAVADVIGDIGAGGTGPDGVPDTIIADTANSSVLIYSGSKSNFSFFNPPLQVSTINANSSSTINGSHPVCVVVANLRAKIGVTVNDIITGNADGTVSVLFNRGDGTFEAPRVFLATTQLNGDSTVKVQGDVTCIATGHFSTSGALDIVVGADKVAASPDELQPNPTGTAPGIAILKGLGDGTFVAGATVQLTDPVLTNFDPLNNPVPSKGIGIGSVTAIAAGNLSGNELTGTGGVKVATPVDDIVVTTQNANGVPTVAVDSTGKIFTVKTSQSNIAVLENATPDGNTLKLVEDPAIALPVIDNNNGGTPAAQLGSSGTSLNPVAINVASLPGDPAGSASDLVVTCFGLATANSATQQADNATLVVYQNDNLFRGDANALGAAAGTGSIPHTVSFAGESVAIEGTPTVGSTTGTSAELALSSPNNGSGALVANDVTAVGLQVLDNPGFTGQALSTLSQAGSLFAVLSQSAVQQDNGTTGADQVSVFKLAHGPATPVQEDVQDVQTTSTTAPVAKGPNGIAMANFTTGGTTVAVAVVVNGGLPASAGNPGAVTGAQAFTVLTNNGAQAVAAGANNIFDVANPVLLNANETNADNVAIATNQFTTGGVKDAEDAIVAAGGSSTNGEGGLSVFSDPVGNGQFTLVSQANLTSGGSDTVGLALLDVNNDTHPDAVVTNQTSAGLDVFLNSNGTTTFSAATPIPFNNNIGAGPFSLTSVAGFQSNFGPFLAVSNFTANGNGTGGQLFLLRSSAKNGVFDDQFRLDGIGDEPLVVAAADINGDGLTDLVVSTNQGAQVFLQQTAGTTAATLFTATPSTSVASTTTLKVSGMAVGPLTSAHATAGINDIVIANTDGTVTVAINNGTGTFGTPKSFQSSGTNFGGQSSNVAIADLNGDGNPDLVVTNSTANDAAVLLGNGDGTFQAPQGFVAQGGPSGVAGVSNVNGAPSKLIVGTSQTFKGTSKVEFLVQQP
ncbi:MAG: FG-GAP-like repeat-containing protein [Candidatus Xenobia bacterium]